MIRVQIVSALTLEELGQRKEAYAEMGWQPLGPIHYFNAVRFQVVSQILINLRQPESTA